MTKYLCQLIGYDKPDQWGEVDAFGPRGAAVAYAEECDSRSAGELFEKPDDTQIIAIQGGGSFTVGFDYAKTFYTKDG